VKPKTQKLIGWLMLSPLIVAAAAFTGGIALIFIAVIHAEASRRGWEMLWGLLDVLGILAIVVVAMFCVIWWATWACGMIEDARDRERYGDRP
jgi:hypothetical protein